MKTGDTLDPAGEKRGRNTRIVKGRYFAEFFIEDSIAGSIYHWAVSRLDGAGLVALGEQTTFEIARQEAEHHLMTLVNADNTGDLGQAPRAVGA